MYDYFSYDYPLFRPPSEARSLIFQVTLGCSQNTCTFCGMYKMKSFRVRPVAEVLKEIERIPVAHRPYVQRVFLADGDALVYPQAGLVEILDRLSEVFVNLNRVGIYASPNSLTTKSVEELAELRSRKLRILYFGLESGDDATLVKVKKGFNSEQMLTLCRKAQQADMKLSITAILGLAGAERSLEHARATAGWVTCLSPEYFSLLTMFTRDNEAFLRSIVPLTRGGIVREASEIVRNLNPQRTILRSNHVSNFLHLAGSYPKDRDRLIAEAEAALAQAQRHPEWADQVPDYQEDLF
jgi:radical SAM superfamily enzyme YgiQ (UPF0313 family)